MRLNFEIVRDQVDRTLRYERLVGLVGLIAKTPASTTATAAAFSPSTIRRSASLRIVMSSSGVLALMLLLVAVATAAGTTHSLAIVRLLLPWMVLLLVVAHVRMLSIIFYHVNK